MPQPWDQLPQRWAERLERLAATAPGRVGLNTLHGVRRLELLDRSMVVAAQFFSSVFPIVVIALAWASRREATRVFDVLGLPPSAADVFGAGEGASGLLGLVGLVVALIGATSLSRALARTYAVIWDRPRPTSTLRDAWRWLAVVLTFVLSLSVVRALATLSRGLPAAPVWSLVGTLLIGTAAGIAVPWLLLRGRVTVRRLLPSGLLWGLLLMVSRPVSAAVMPGLLQSSSDRYGPMGVAFTGLTWLYVMSVLLLGSALLGRVISEDHGRLGRWLRAGDDPGTPVRVDSL